MVVLKSEKTGIKAQKPIFMLLVRLVLVALEVC